MSLLQVVDVHKRYGETQVLRGVSFEVQQGQIVVIMGPSGAGKSTLLRTINYLVPPDSGAIFFKGQKVIDDQPVLRQIRSQIGFVFQHFNLFSHLTALENITLGLTRVKKMSKEQAYRTAMECLEIVGLSEKAQSYPSQLSGGQKQRVAIARALAMRPDLILFDEPTSALDPTLVGEVHQVMKKLAMEGHTMVVVTHEVSFAKSVACRILYMENGIILEDSDPVTFFTQPLSQSAKAFIANVYS
ncbi:MAG TPA: amino acid ABC transporter ATP-binding protein [Pseudothermotoga sp.]|nr:amino acid ABC transporter ATP-binding protein [Pseudothermotoga sp.]HPP69739.1 amino acid ABC transporter ATP-binding protein [Pseudothermotoga sp.]